MGQRSISPDCSVPGGARSSTTLGALFMEEDSLRLTWGYLNVNEIIQNPQSRWPGLFRVELNTHHIVLANGHD